MTLDMFTQYAVPVTKAVDFGSDISCRDVNRKFQSSIGIGSLNGTAVPMSMTLGLAQGLALTHVLYFRISSKTCTDPKSANLKLAPGLALAPCQGPSCTGIFPALGCGSIVGLVL